MRRPVKKKTHVEPDLKYQSLLVSKIINRIMVAGKKSIATGIVYRALELAEEKTKKPALEVLETAITNAAPNMELKSRRVGGANYQVPIEELLNAFNNTGGAVKKKLDMHRMADANKAFAHFAW